MNKKFAPLILSIVALCALGLWLRPARGGGGRDQNDFEQLLAKSADAIVTVKYVSKTSDGDGDFENEDEFYGIMIDSTGLVLAASSQMGFGDWGGQTVPKDIKVLIGDDTDGLPAKVLARDSELDLIWIQVKEPGDKKFAAIDFANDAKPRLGDRILSIEKKTDFYDRAAIISEDRIGGLLKKPRDLYASSRGLFSAIGMPVFSIDGRVVGLFVEHSPESTHLDAGESDWSDTDYLILPSATVVKATEQARKSGSPKKEVAEEEEEEE